MGAGAMQVLEEVGGELRAHRRELAPRRVRAGLGSATRCGSDGQEFPRASREIPPKGRCEWQGNGELVGPANPRPGLLAGESATRATPPTRPLGATTPRMAIGIIDLRRPCRAARRNHSPGPSLAGGEAPAPGRLSPPAKDLGEGQARLPRHPTPGDRRGRRGRGSPTPTKPASWMRCGGSSRRPSTEPAARSWVHRERRRLRGGCGMGCSSIGRASPRSSTATPWKISAIADDATAGGSTATVPIAQTA